MKFSTTLFCFSVFCLSLSAQTVDTDRYRTINGEFNNPNPARSTWGMAHSPLTIPAGVGFANGFSTPAGPNRPNPRFISNEIFAQSDLLNDPVGLSDFTWVFGQFIDHDITLTEHPGEPLMIPVPRGDVHFDPFGTGRVVIPMTRNGHVAGTGLKEGNPRRYDNDITAFIDGSAVYGSDPERAEWLRTHQDGKLRTSRGNLLPYNTTNSEASGFIDANAPHMANGTGSQIRQFYVAGDLRANENPLLASFHTLFVREHNRQCELLKNQYPDWSDEQLYQHARKLVGGILQSIVYDEWLPTMGVPVLPYTGYDPGINPQLANEFSAAAFRVGHTLLNSNLRRMNANGEPHPRGPMTLRSAFFNFEAIHRTGGIEPFLRGMAEQTQQRMDAHVVDDVRNFLFGPPGAGGLDLAAINIMRGRERGLPTYNRIRIAYGLSPVVSFREVNPDPEVYRKLEAVYTDNINDLDPWVGMLAEHPEAGSIFGPTLRAVLGNQFSQLRTGDRFYYENDPVLNPREKQWIRETTFRDIIMYNTDIDLMQDNVFEAMPFAEICGDMTVNVDGLIRTHGNQTPLSGVGLMATSEDGSTIMTAETDELGFFDFSTLPACTMTALQSSGKADDWLAGVDIFDLVGVRDHILNRKRFASPYQFIAADADGSHDLDVGDLIRMLRLILNRDDALDSPNGTPWVFVPAGYAFSDPDNPLADDYPLEIDFSEVSPAEIGQGFVAIKRGDVDDSYSVSPSGLLAGGLDIELPDGRLEAGTPKSVTLQLRGDRLEGFQFGLRTSGGARIKNVSSPDLPAESIFLSPDGTLRVAALGDRLPTSARLELTLSAPSSGPLSDFLHLSEAVDFASRAVTDGGTPAYVNLSVGDRPLLEVAAYPNPFVDRLLVNWDTALPYPVELRLTDLNGRTVATSSVAPFASGSRLEGLNLPAGAYQLQLIGKGGMSVATESLIAR